MTDDLEYRLRELVSTAGTRGRLPKAAELRRRGDRRRVQQVTLGVLALIAIGGSYTVGAGRIELGGGPAPAGEPTVSISSSPALVPSPTPTSTSTSKSDLSRQQKVAAAKTSSLKKKAEAVKSAGRLHPGPIQLSGPTVPGEQRLVQVASDGSATVDARGEPGGDGTRFILRSAGADAFLLESRTSGRCLIAEPKDPLRLTDCDSGAPAQRFVFSYQGGHLYTIGTPSGLLRIDPVSLEVAITNESPTVFKVTVK